MCDVIGLNRFSVDFRGNVRDGQNSNEMFPIPNSTTDIFNLNENKGFEEAGKNERTNFIKRINSKGESRNR